MAPSPRRTKPRTPVDASRHAAYDALLLIESADAYLNLTLPRLLSERSISGRDAGFTTELANGTARLQGSYDAIVDPLVKGGVELLQPEVKVGLRMGAHQLLSMRVPDHAAVGTTVELVREAVGERPVRLVNAVLRRIGNRSLVTWLADVAPARDVDPVGHLAVVHSHPRWIVEALLDALPDSTDIDALLAADNVAALVTLASRPGLSDVTELIGESVRPGRWSPYAAVLEGGDPASLGAVRSGRAGVQDEGSQLAALTLARAPVAGDDRRWLDLCAGPGGKAALLTGLAHQRGATLVAAERLHHRSRLVQSGLRAYPAPHPVVTADGLKGPWNEATFDRVITDVPCSGLGSLRRRPESRWRRQASDVASLVPLQTALLVAALQSARRGGVVAYVTCSPHRAETRGVVDAVVRTFDAEGIVVHEEDVRPLLPELSHLGEGPHLQLWPHVHGTDAMFVSLLRRS